MKMATGRRPISPDTVYSRHVPPIVGPVAGDHRYTVSVNISTVSEDQPAATVETIGDRSDSFDRLRYLVYVTAYWTADLSDHDDRCGVRDHSLSDGDSVNQLPNAGFGHNRAQETECLPYYGRLSLPFAGAI